MSFFICSHANPIPASPNRKDIANSSGRRTVEFENSLRQQVQAWRCPPDSFRRGSQESNRTHVLASCFDALMSLGRALFFCFIQLFGDIARKLILPRTQKQKATYWKSIQMLARMFRALNWNFSCLRNRLTVAYMPPAPVGHLALLIELRALWFVKLPFLHLCVDCSHVPA